MQIVYLNAGSELGGAERSLLDLMSSMVRLPEPPDVSLFVGSNGPLSRRAEAMGLQVRVVPMPDTLSALGDSALGFGGRLGAAMSLAIHSLPAGLATVRYLGELRKTLREVSPSFVHSNDNKSHILASLAAGRNIPVIWHVRDFVGSRAIIARGLRWCSRRSRGAIAISEAVGRDIQRILPSLPTKVVYNAIDLEHFSPGHGEGRWLDGLAGMRAAAEGTIRIGLVATYGRWKGHDLFLQAAERFITSSGRADPSVRFYIIGGPIYRTRGSQFSDSELKSMAVSKGIVDHVGFVPFQEETAPVYRALDVVVHASVKPEPFGRTIVEAMACARPVVVSRAGGAAELFEHGKDALGFSPGSADDLAATIRTLAMDEDLRIRIGQNARKTALERFCKERLAGEVMSAYSRFASGSLSSSRR